MALENKTHTGAVLSDLSKAFDCLPHQLIVAKFNAYGLSTKSCALLWSYLSDRIQRVKLSGTMSDWQQLLKGVPQGSVMGPVMFNVFINDLFAIIKKSTLTNYADDNTISASKSTRVELVQTLTSESETAIKWFRDNYMEANASKFQAIILNDSDTNTFNIDREIILSTDTVKLLGVTIDSKLSFTPHTKEVCRKAAAQISALQRLQNLLDYHARMTIFSTFITSQFKYCSLIWHFCGEVNTAKMERLQYRALKFVFKDKTATYSELLERAKIPTLQLSRKRAIILEVYKAVHHLSPKFLWDIFREKSQPYNLRNQGQMERTTKRTKRFGTDTFSDYGAKLWNSIPNNVKDLDIKQFKVWLATWSDNV